jgi:hypothetical protein
MDATCYTFDNAANPITYETVVFGYILFTLGRLSFVIASITPECDLLLRSTFSAPTEAAMSKWRDQIRMGRKHGHGHDKLSQSEAEAGEGEGAGAGFTISQQELLTAFKRQAALAAASHQRSRSSSVSESSAGVGDSSHGPGSNSAAPPAKFGMPSRNMDSIDVAFPTTVDLHNLDTIFE